jgi:alkylation response protein AidB-like acyl-CoA dehydrogenase
LEQSRRWSEEERIVLEQVEHLCADVIAPRAAEIDRTGAFPWENIAAINDLGLNGVFVPEAYGGAPGSFRLYLACVKRIAEACASTAIIYATTFHGMKPLIAFGNDEQKQRLLPRIAQGGLGAISITESHSGSDATAMRVTFREDGDTVIVDGEKMFVTNGDVADLILLFGKWSGIDDPRGAITALVVEKGASGMSVTRIEDKMGHRASSTAALSFSSCRVPKANILGGPGAGVKILLPALNMSRPSIAAHALGIAHAAFNDMVAYMNERRQFDRRLSEFQANQILVADLVSELATTELWLDHVANLADSGVSDIAREASIAKVRASDLAMRMATEAVQMHGGYGYCRDFRVERLMRDAKVTQIWEGTNLIHRQLIGRSFVTR